MVVAAPESNGLFGSSVEGPARFRFSTDDLPERDRLTILREVIGKHVSRLEIEPLPNHALRVRTRCLRLPGLFAYWSRPSPVQMRRTRALLSDGNDNLLLQWTNRTRLVQHLGQEIVVGPGEATLFSCSDTRTTRFESECDTVVLSVPRPSLEASLCHLDGSLARPVPANSGALNLLLGYLELLRDKTPVNGDLDRLVVSHVCDLLAVTLGATRDAQDIARKRGLRAARLAAIKQGIRQNLSRARLAGIAAKHGHSPRYVQTLFEEDGTTLTEFVLEERLVHARRVLMSPRSAGSTIAEIALDCGFGDISYFNRRFRARFGASPTDVRNGVS